MKTKILLYPLPQIIKRNTSHRLGEKFCNFNAYNYKIINIQSIKELKIPISQERKEKLRKNGQFSKRKAKWPISIFKDTQH